MAVSLLVSSTHAAELLKAKYGSDVYGYKDTPKLRWCEWLVHNHQQVYGATGHRVLPNYNRAVSKGSIALAGHGCPVAFPNIWIRPPSEWRPGL